MLEILPVEGGTVYNGIGKDPYGYYADYIGSVQDPYGFGTVKMRLYCRIRIRG